MRNLLTHLKAEGVRLSLSLDGKLEVTGDREAVKKLLPEIKKNKAELMAALSNKTPEWCAGPGCPDYEVITLSRAGRTPGCILRDCDMETWRRLDRMDSCPIWH